MSSRASVDDDAGGDDDDEPSEEEKDAMSLRCLRIMGVLMILLGGGLCGGALYSSTIVYSSTAVTVMYVIASVGGALLATNILGLLSVWGRAHIRTLLFYYTCLVVLAFASLAGAGFCFLFTNTAVAAVTDNWDTFIASVPPSQRASFTRESMSRLIRTIMYASGGGGVILFTFSMIAMNHATRLLTPVRAYTMLLQSTSLALTPVGIALIGIAAYLASTAIGAQASVAAFALFILGIFIICVLLIGCVGASLHSRGIVRVFSLLAVLLSTVCSSFGVLALIQADVVTKAIGDQWSYLRAALPDGFAGKYNKQAFVDYLATNITSLGFLALCAAALMCAQVWASSRLRAELQMEAELEQEAFRAAETGAISHEDAATIAAARSVSKAQRMWKQNWTKGSSWTRRVILCGCASMCLLVAGAICVAAAALYYATSCVSTGGYADTLTYSTPVGSYAYAVNNFTAGSIRVLLNQSAVTPDMYVAVRNGAYTAAMATKAYPPLLRRNVTVAAALTTGGTASMSTIPPSCTVAGMCGVDVLGAGFGSAISAGGVSVRPLTQTYVLGWDVSCQTADVTVYIPPAAVLGVSPVAIEAVCGVSGSTAVNVDMSSYAVALVPAIRYIQAMCVSGDIMLKSASIGAKGVDLYTVSGGIYFTTVRAVCDAADIGTAAGGIRMRTRTGVIGVAGLTTTDCDVVITGGDATVTVDAVTMRNAFGGATCSVAAGAGTLSVTRANVDVLSVTGETGAVLVDNVTIHETLRVAADSAPVTLTNIRADARVSVQVETGAGGVYIRATAYAGVVSVVTSGTVTCAGAGFDSNAPCAVVRPGGNGANIVEGETVNCARIGDCPYAGALTITSNSGNVVLVMDAWAR